MRVFVLGEEVGDVLWIGEDWSVKLVLRGSRSVPFLKSRGKERRFSSTVEAGDADRGESIKDIETVRLFGGREAVDVDDEGVGGWLSGAQKV